MKVKIFADDHSDHLEAKINKWLGDNSWIRIERIEQSTGSPTTYISIWYSEPDVPILG